MTVATTCLNVTTVLSSKLHLPIEMGRHQEALENCQQAVSLLDSTIQDGSEDKSKEEVRWKLAVGLNNLGVEYQYLNK